MTLIVDLGILVTGIAILLKGADFFIDSAANIARRFKVSEFLIGLSLVALATSLPELAVSVTAAFLNSTGIVIGNVVGSNIANIGLIIGLSALFFTIKIDIRDVEEGFVMCALLFIFALFAINGLEQWEGFILFSFVVIYFVDMFTNQQQPKTVKKSKDYKGLPAELIFCIIGVIGVILGSRLAVDSAVSIATWAGVSELIIGLTIIAIGTSLPELVTSVVAASKGLSGIAMGNIIGSNIFNISMVLGVSAMITRIPVTSHLMFVDIPIMIILPTILLLFMFTRWKLTRKEGMVIFLIYLAFIVFQLPQL